VLEIWQHIVSLGLHTRCSRTQVRNIVEYIRRKGRYFLGFEDFFYFILFKDGERRSRIVA